MYYSISSLTTDYTKTLKYESYLEKERFVIPTPKLRILLEFYVSVSWLNSLFFLHCKNRQCSFFFKILSPVNRTKTVRKEGFLERRYFGGILVAAFSWKTVKIKYLKALYQSGKTSCLKVALNAVLVDTSLNTCHYQDIWDKVFKNRSSKICERQPLKNLKWYGLLRQAISLEIF